MPNIIKNRKFALDIDVNNINPEVIEEIIKQHKNIVQNRFKILDEYYQGKHDILNRKLDADKPNNKIPVNKCMYISDVLTGMYMGKTPSYTCLDRNYLDTLSEIFKLNDEQSVDNDLASKCSIKGTAFEMVYMDENSNVCFDSLDTDSTIVVYDTTIKNEPLIAIRYYNIEDILDSDNVITKVEVYTKDKIYYYNAKDEYILEKVQDHYFGEVPIIEYPNNRYRSGDFEGIIALNDAYNKNYADIANDIEYYSNCYLVIKGMESTTKEDIKEASSNRVLNIPDGGDAYFVTKQINDSTVSNFRKALNEDIFQTAMCPDLSQDLPSNLSGSAIKTKYFATLSCLSKKERAWKKALTKRIRLITKILNIKGNNFSADDVTITFNTNLPLNLIEFADSVSKFNGTISKRTLLANIPIVEDVEAELRYLKEEQESFQNDLFDTIPNEGDLVAE